MKKTKYIIILSFLIFVLGLAGYANRKSAENVTEKLETISGEGRYSITQEFLPSKESNGSLDGTIRFMLKNLNITPFITNLGIERGGCTMTDLNGKRYNTSATIERKLTKALLPGEEVSLRIDKEELIVSFFQEGEVLCRKEGAEISANNQVKCIYNNSGECTCEDIGVLQVNSCLFRITTNGDHASGGGKYPLSVTIQNKN